MAERFWNDKFCIDQTNIVANLMCLGLHVFGTSMVDSHVVVAVIFELKIFRFSAVAHLSTDGGFSNGGTLDSHNFLALQV